MSTNRIEMKYLVFCAAFSLLFLVNVVSSVSITAKYDVNETQTKKFEVKQAVQLVCKLNKEEGETDRLEVQWEKNGTQVLDIPKFKDKVSISHIGNVYKLQFSSAEQADAGNYACVVYANQVPKTWANITVESKIYVKLPRDNTVVEGENLRVICKVHGDPNSLEVVWIYRNVTYDKSYDPTDGRVELETEEGIKNAVFILKKVSLEDQDELTCKGVSTNTKDSSAPATGRIRVKDKYAALWPFIGICAEVIVLCAIIFIYEKKRNKQELEESDTDQSPEQKNTPDHGGKESNLRHRQ